jgi:dipeptidyl aminopeptidase/acylaminoacyl peptidase
MSGVPARLFLVALLLLPALPLTAQEPYHPDSLTARDYEQAERFLAWNTASLVYNSGVRPAWISNDRFWYRVRTGTGTDFVLVDPAKRTRTEAFNRSALAAALSAAADTSYNSDSLPFTSFEYTEDGRSITFPIGRQNWTCSADGTECHPADATSQARRADRNEIESPDGSMVAFTRENNLWVRNVESGQETQLTADGADNYGYATNNAGWTRSDRPVLLWSPDSKKIATFRHDSRPTGDMYVVRTEVGHPKLEAWKYPLPGDSAIFMIERVILNADGSGMVRLDMPPDAHRSTICDHVVCDASGWSDVYWSPDASQLAFVSSSRDHKDATLRVANAETGAVRTLFTEHQDTWFESGVESISWRVLWDRGKVLWFSQRDDWGNLYLYDLDSGELERQLTRGPGTVLEVVRVDEGAGTVWFTAGGREAGRDPYFEHLYSVGLDGRNARLLTPENANHSITFSPSGRYFVDSYSTPTEPQVTVVRDARGGLRASIEKADISALLATGWKPPMPFTVKARDGKTDLYGLLFRPVDFDSTKQYPIVNNIYPGPQTGSVGGRSFSPARSDAQALAELGFIVVQLDAMGTPGRSKSFHDAYFGNMGDNGLPDQVTGMKQLAERFSWIDIDRAGIYGHSGGGYATSGALFHYPDFFKVGVSQAGNHDNRVYEDDWAEKWQGLLKHYGQDSTGYDAQANQNFAKNLKGKLLLAHGSTDNNVPFYSTLLVVDELIKENKDFDLIIFPNRRHGFGSEPYMIRRRWDYFVTNLLGAAPPAGFEVERPNFR